MDERQRALNDEGRALWDQKAEFWDALHGDQGNRFHQRLVSPSVERLLDLKPGECVLDIACGSGVLARRLAALGGRVTAVDFSAELMERAKARRQDGGEPIQYSVVDATDEAALLTLGEGQYPAVVCTMALMDIPVIAPLYRAVRRLLSAEGRFVFAIGHPAFNSTTPVMCLEREEVESGTLIRHSLKLSAYLNNPPFKAMGAPGEPVTHTYYHRPLQQLLNEAFAAGLILDGLEEPAFSEADAEPERPLSWSNFSQFPPVLVGRLRPGI